MGSLRRAALAASVIVFVQTTAAVSAPREVEASISAARENCGGKVELGKTFISRQDVNGDGVEDYILDYGAFSCDGMSSFFCGSAGCTQEVFASLPGGAYVSVFGENAYAIEFKIVRGKPAMLLSLHGSACGKAGAAECRKTLLWNGKTFKPSR